MKLARRLQWYLIGIVLTLVVLYIISLAGFGIPGLIETGLLAMTPLALAAVGECLSEQAGTTNVGMEGIFLITAILGVYWAEIFESGVYGLLFGAITGAVIGLLFGLVCVYGKANQVIAGMGLNIFALGFGPYLLCLLYTSDAADDYSV